MEIKITDLKDTKITGVRVSLAEEHAAYKENYFEWTAFPLKTEFKTNEIVTGLLEAWHHTPDFNVIEYHEDKELFCFVDGTALMLFIDIKDGKPVMDTAQIVRVPQGTEMEIEAGKGHFVAVAEDTKFSAIVVSPAQDAPRIDLPEVISGK